MPSWTARTRFFIADVGEGDVREWLAYMGELYLAGSLDPATVISVTTIMESAKEIQWLRRPISIEAGIVNGLQCWRGR